MYKKYNIITILIIIALLGFALFKKSKIVTNKEIAVGVIIKSSYSNIRYQFVVKGTKYTGNRGANFVDTDYVGRKHIVVYNRSRPENNFMLLNYPLRYDLRLNHDLNHDYDKDTISFSFLLI